MTHVRFFSIFAVVLLVLASCETAEVEQHVASTSQAEEWTPALVGANGLLPGAQRYHPPGLQIAATVCAGAHLSYFGGPLLQTPIIVPVFWATHVNATVTANIGQFYADVTQSSYWSMLQEYDSVGRSPGSNQAILGGTATAGVTIAPVRCTSTTACTVDDAQIQTELARQILLGVLPAPALDCSGNVKTIYMVHFPSNVSVRDPSLNRSCVAGGFCAYHNTGTYGPSNVPLIFGVMPDVFAGGCATGCGSNATALQNLTSVASHELAEAATDTDVGLVVGNAMQFPGGWYDNNCGEIADICDDGSKGDTITVSGRTWTVQQLWSNAQGKCASSSPALAICAGTTTTNCRKCSCDDSGAACGGSTTVCETNAANVLFGACEQCTATSHAACASGTCQQSATPASDDLCSCTPATTCPAGDNCGTVPDGCGGTVSCGACSGTQTCGGGGKANVCGCTPATTCPGGDDCGTVPDGCGGSVSCGACSGTQTCGGGGTANVCGCTPATTCPAGDNCGTAPDGCGGTVNCGSCAGVQTCGGAGTVNVCGCTPLTACPAGATCGTVSDTCGGTVSCGACGTRETCAQNECVGLDAGVSDAGVEDAGTPEEDGGLSSTDAGADAGIVHSDPDLPDAGTTPGPKAGCGCQTSEVPSTMLLGVLGVVLARRRRAS